MADPTYKYHPVYNDKGKLIEIDPPEGLPVTNGRQLRMGYPFHILKKKGDKFIVQDISLTQSLRSQASKRNAASKSCRLQVTQGPTGLIVTRVK